MQKKQLNSKKYVYFSDHSTHTKKFTNLWSLSFALKNKTIDTQKNAETKNKTHKELNFI